MARKRPSSTRRGYGVKHRRVRLKVLKRDKTCRARTKQGRRCKRKAKDAAHVKDMRDGGKTTLANMRGLCHSPSLAGNGAAAQTARAKEGVNVALKRRKIRHRCGDQVCFHGSFTSPGKAREKAKMVKGSRVKFVKTQGGSRYVVLTKKG